MNDQKPPIYHVSRSRSLLTLFAVVDLNLHFTILYRTCAAVMSVNLMDGMYHKDCSQYRLLNESTCMHSIVGSEAFWDTGSLHSGNTSRCMHFSMHGKHCIILTNDMLNLWFVTCLCKERWSLMTEYSYHSKL